MAHRSLTRTVLSLGACCLVVSAGIAAAAPQTATAAPEGSVALASGDGAALLACTAPSTQRINISSGGAQATDWSININGPRSLSADGRYVVFASDASNLVPGDVNRGTKGGLHVFVRDRLRGTTELIDRSSTGAQANDQSGDPAISADGRYVAFDSMATNLVPGATNEHLNVFVRDMASGTTQLVSVSRSGGPGDGDSGAPALSADGRYVAFSSSATDLVAHDTNSTGDVFVRDRLSGTTELVSVATSGTQGNDGSGAGDNVSISGDGRYVAFASAATNLAPGDTNPYTNIYVRDRARGTTQLVNVTATGQASADGAIGPAISADGRYVTFSATAADLVAGATGDHEDVLVRDLVTGVTQLVSVSDHGAQGNQDSGLFGGAASAISADGRYVAFDSQATNLVAGVTDGWWHVFLRDRARGTTELTDIPARSARPGEYGSSGSPSISADGRYVAFESSSPNLVPEDTNDSDDVFVRDRGVQTGACGSAATATLDWHFVQTGSHSGYGFVAVAVAGSQVCFGVTWSSNLPTPTGADLDLATAPGTPAVTLFTGTPGPHTSARTAWGCLTITPAVAADIAQHPDRYLLTVRTAQYPAGAIAGRLQA